MVTTKSVYVVNVVSQGLGRLLTTLANFFVFVLIARHLGADTFGKFSYIVTFWVLVSTFAEFGTQTVLAKDIAQIKEDAGLYWGNFLILRTLLCLAAAAIALVTAFLIRRDLFAYIALGCLLIPFLSWRFYDPIFQVFHKPWYALAASVVFSVGYFGLMTAVIKGGGNLMSIVGVYLLTNAVYTLLLMRLSGRLLRPQWKIDRPILRKILKLSVPLGVASIYTIINSRADIFLLAYLKSDDAVGVYNAAYRFLDFFTILAATCVVPLIPIFAKKANDNRASLRESYIKVMGLFSVALIPLAVITPFISSALIRLFFGESFLGAAQALNILVWAAVLVFYSLASSALCVSLGIVSPAYWNGAIAAGLNIFLNSFWIPRYGYIGSAWATLVSEVSLLSVVLYYVVRNIGNIFDGQGILKIIAANLMLYFLLWSNIMTMNVLARLTLALAVYTAAIFFLRIISINMICAYFVKKCP